MKKNKLYTVTKYNRPAFMPYADYTNAYDLGGLVNGITDKLGGAFGGNKLMANGSPNLGGSLIGAAGSAVGGLAKKVLSGGLNSGAGNAVANIGGTVGGIVSNFNPLLGGIISAGTGIIGGGINALFGSKVDEKKLAAVNADITRGNNFVSNAGTFEDIKGPAAFMTNTNVYSGGLLRDMSGKNNELAQKLFAAKNWTDRSIENNVNNIWGDMVNDAMFNYSAFGGPLNTYGGALGLMQNDKYIDAINNRSDAIMGKSNNTLSNPQTYFGDGGGIHISPSKKGTFTAAASKHGMGVQEFASKVLANKDDYSPEMVKKANFARNAAKWHAFGGELGTNGTDWTNGLLYVDAGGTHQQNPLGGVPVGFDQNGTPNLVEEGETIWNDYVFSDRIKVPKAMFHTLGLGGAMKKGITFAHASKKLAKESEMRPNDPISMAGLEASLSKLAMVQEAERMKKEMRRYVGLENMAANGGTMNRYDYGGALKWLKERYGNKYNSQELDALAKYLSNKVSDTTTVKLNSGNEIQDSKGKSLLDQEYSNALYDVVGNSFFGFGKDKLDNLVGANINPELAYDIVSKDLRQGDNRNQLYRYMSSLPSAAPSAASISPEETITPSVQNSGVDEFLAAMDNTTTLPQREASAQQQARTRAAALGYTPGVGGGVRSQSGIIPYAYYTNGSDGLGEPTGFVVGKNGLIDKNSYTQEYRDLVSKLTADDIRKWVDAHPNDSSYLSFKNRGNDINKLTDEQWRTGATDGKYGFMHHVANSILNGDYTPANAMQDPGKLERNGRITFANSPNTDVVIGNNSEQAAGNNNNTENGDTGRLLEKNPKLLPTWMRYAPAVGGAIGVFGDLLGLTNKPDYTYADRLEAAANSAGYAPQVGYKPIGDYERYTPFDRLFYANQMQANARGTDRMLANTSSPSRAAGLLANAYNTNNALGNLYRQGDEYNLAQYQQVKDFNRRTNMFNSQMGLEADITNARYRQMAKNYQMEGLGRAAALRDAIDQRVGAARSANLTNLFNSLGNIGRENFTFNQINTDPSRVYGTGTRGNVFYWPREMQEEYQKGIEEEAQRLEKERKAASKACGGKMNRNKK